MQDETADSREEQRLSRALQGKVGGNKRASIWAPVQTKPTSQVPVNYTGAQSGSVDTTSPYSNSSAIADEKLRQEQARLKKWGLDGNNNGAAPQEPESPSSTSSTPGLQSSQSLEQQFDDKAALEERRLTKMGLSSTNLLEDHNIPAHKTVPGPNSNVDSSPVDNSSILSNVDGTPSEEKMRQEQKRLERWGLKIGGTSPTLSATTTPVVSSQPSQTVTSPSTPAAQTPSSPFVEAQSQTIASQYQLPVETVKPFLDKIIYAAKSIKLILHKKSSNHEVAIAILLDLVQQSASFAVNLSADLPISFDISQSAGRLAGAVNELVKNAQDREPAQTIKIYEEIQSLLGLLYLGVVAH